MPSKFPGMDPYLEGQVWADFHHRLITELATSLMPELRPRYAAVIEERVYLEHTPSEPARSIGPDVTVYRESALLAPARSGGTASTTLMTEPMVAPLRMPEEVREAYLEIRLRETHEVVAVMEVLSPTNKRKHSDGQREYLSKRNIVLRSMVHFVEIDLLRGGEQVLFDIPLPPSDYRITVSRAPERPMAEVWNLSLLHRLPVIPIPLAGSDPDVFLDLQAVFNTVYDRAGYDYMLDYKRGTIPPLEEELAEWAKGLLSGE